MPAMPAGSGEPHPATSAAIVSSSDARQPEGVGVGVGGRHARPQRDDQRGEAPGSAGAVSSSAWRRLPNRPPPLAEGRADREPKGFGPNEPLDSSDQPLVQTERRRPD